MVYLGAHGELNGGALCRVSPPRLRPFPRPSAIAAASLAAANVSYANDRGAPEPKSYDPCRITGSAANMPEAARFKA